MAPLNLWIDLSSAGKTFTSYIFVGSKLGDIFAFYESFTYFLSDSLVLLPKILFGLTEIGPSYITSFRAPFTCAWY